MSCSITQKAVSIVIFTTFCGLVEVRRKLVAQANAGRELLVPEGIAPCRPS